MDEMALAHRYRFVAPLCAGRIVRDLAGASAHRGALAEALGFSETEADIVLALAAPADVLTSVTGLIGSLRPDGRLVLAFPDESGTALRSTLAARFRFVATYIQRPVLGSIVASSRFAESRAAMLVDAAPAAARGWTILVCGETADNLTCGLFEAPLPDVPPPLRPPVERAARSHDSGPIAARDIARADAVSLVDRLMDLDQAIFALGAENRELRERIATARSAAPTDGTAIGGVSLRTPVAAVSWPLVENPDTPPGELGVYERRPDDDVVAGARDGDAFLAAHGLLGATPDFATAVAALNAARPALDLVDDAAAPDVSIVIPVHGQLAYTLNCLDALFAQHSAHRAEIIVVDDASPDASGVFLSRVGRIRVHRNEQNRGFIAACNIGGGLARGRFVVLLNNDTRPLPGWLDGLIECFSLFPGAGLVGSKLLYADGRLQEAGGIVWRDGRAWNYGRNDDPNRPEYCHARQVDYVSGAAIALPAAMWRDLGGLDPYYAPAYYEDTDIAFRVRALGHQVWLQPLSRVIHYEGRTGGTDIAAGVKSFQAINRGKFFYRWRETLLRHGDDRAAIARERERQVTRRAVLLDDTTPTPRQDAGSNYTLLTMRLFIALGYKLSFVPQDNFLYQQGHTTDLHRIGIECAYAPYYFRTEAYLRRHGGGFDIVMVSRLQVLEQVIGELEAFAPQAPILFNTHDLNFLRMRREAELVGDSAMLAAADAMRERELALMRRVDCVITPSAYEGEILARELADVPSYVLPIMTDFEGTDIGFEARRDVCFLGGYRHPPNVDAVRYFLDEIFPLLKAGEPDLRFVMAGANPTPELLALAREDVIVTGMIDDLREVFDRVRVFVCPLRIGAGAKGKVASAMSYGLPIVATSIGAEGMGLVDGETVLVADTPAEFAAACLRLYRDRALWESVSAASLALVRRVASAEAREGIFGAAIDAALRHKFGVL